MSELLLFWKLKQHTVSLLQLILLTYDLCTVIFTSLTILHFHKSPLLIGPLGTLKITRSVIKKLITLRENSGWKGIFRAH